MKTAVLASRNPDPILANVIRGQGYSVLTPLTGAGTIACVKEGYQDLIVLSEDLPPPTGGMEMIATLRRITGAILVVIGDGSDTSIIASLLDGADLYMKRPVSTVEFVARLAAMERRAWQWN